MSSPSFPSRDKQTRPTNATSELSEPAAGALQGYLIQNFRHPTTPTIVKELLTWTSSLLQFEDAHSTPLFMSLDRGQLHKQVEDKCTITLLVLKKKAK